MAKVFLAFPVYDKKVDVEIMQTVAQLPALYPQTQFVIDFIATSLITTARNYLVKRFLNTDCDWLYFWDSDVIIRDTTFLDKLTETASSLNADIVGGAYRIKHDRELYAFGDYDNEGKLVNFKVGDLTKPMLVDTLATGSMLISRKVLETIPRPWFSFVEKPEETIPEDHNFCNIARAAGFKIAVDPRFETIHTGVGSWRHLYTPDE
ncbi:MAG: glycosyltransferase [Patescibacteria group bacterium]